MLDKKTDYRFVTEYAMRNIRVEGKPYCIRHENGECEMPMLAEDVAFMREAILERLYSADGWESGPIVEAFRKTYANTNKDSYFRAYDTYGSRILRVHDTVTDEHGLTKDLMTKCRHGVAFYKRDDLEEIEVPYIIFETSCSQDTEEVNGVLDEIAQVEEEYKEDIAAIDADFTAFKRTKKVIRDDAMSAENARWGQGGAVLKAPYKEACDTAKATASTKRSSSRTAEDTRYAQECVRIKDDEEMEDWEKLEALANEDDKHVKILYKIDAEYLQECDVAQREYDKKVIELEEEHDSKMEAPQEAYDEAVEAEQKIVDNAKERRRTDLDGNIDELLKKIPSVYEKVTQYILASCYNSTWRSYLNARSETKITESCADKWYERDPLYKRASTPTDRVYADLERLDTMAAFNIGYSGYAPGPYGEEDAGKFNTFRMSTAELHYEPVESGGTAAPYDTFTDERPAAGYDVDRQGWSFTKVPYLYFHYGKRHELDQIEKISVDVVYRRKGSMMPDAEGKEATITALVTASAISLSMTDARNHFRYDDFNKRFVITGEDELDEETRIKAEKAIEDENARLSDRLSEVEEEYKTQYGVRLYMKRVDMTLKDVPSQSYLEEIDDITDLMNDKTAEYEQEYREAYAGIQATYTSSLNDAEDAYVVAVENARKRHQDRIDTANKSYVVALANAGKSLNDRLLSFPKENGRAPTAAEESEMWAPYYDVVASASNTLSEARTTSADQYNADVSNAYETRRTSNGAASNARTLALSALNEQYYGDSGFIPSVQNSAKDEIAEVIKARDEAYKAINERCDDAIAQAKATASSAMDGVCSNARGICQKAGSEGWSEYESSSSGIRYSYFVALDSATKEVKDAVSSANRQVADALLNQENAVIAATEAAKMNRSYERSDCPPVMLDNRGRFYCQLPELDDELFEHTKDDGESCQIIGIANVTVYFNPRTKTGVDFSAYYQELESE